MIEFPWYVGLMGWVALLLILYIIVKWAFSKDE